jgi:hypothetical protein
MAKSIAFAFQSTDQIGFADADDDKFLLPCFVSTDSFDCLRNWEDGRGILLGRTGAGKTALLRNLFETQTGVIQIKPESLALSYISNSTILNFLSSLGVKLDIFFRLLWRHVFVIEMVRCVYSLNSEARKRSFIDRVQEIFFKTKRDHSRAIKYLERWGESFWKETDYRIKEVTTQLEKELKASLGGSITEADLKMGFEAARRFEEVQRAEILHRAQQVVNQVQIRELSEVMDLLADVLEYEEKSYFIVVDRLDENWVEEKLRYLLIRALIETVRDFSKVKRAKLVVAIRRDLIDRVFRQTRDPGFQEEKYRSLYLRLSWSNETLASLIEMRLQEFGRQRARRPLSAAELLSDDVDGQSALDYMIDRTFLRPRDLLTFVNLAILESLGKGHISPSAIKHAEGDYSRDRFRSLADEWFADYPNLTRVTDLLKKRPATMRISDVSVEQVNEFCLNWVANGIEHDDVFSRAAQSVVDARFSAEDFCREVVYHLYQVGLVGLKLETYEGVFWSYRDERSVSPAEIRSDSRFSIHRMFWRVLGVDDRGSDGRSDKVDVGDPGLQYRE